MIKKYEFQNFVLNIFIYSQAISQKFVPSLLWQEYLHPALIGKIAKSALSETIPEFDSPSFDPNSIFLKFVDLTTPVKDGKSQN